MNVCASGEKRSGACLGKFLERSATLAVTIIVCYKTLKKTAIALQPQSSIFCSQVIPRALIYELPALDEVERRNKTRAEPTELFNQPHMQRKRRV